MTGSEQKLLELTALLWNKFCALPMDPDAGAHPSDTDEFMACLHNLQRIVMARDARRNNPELFNVVTLT